MNGRLRKFAMICLLASVLLLTGCTAKEEAPLRELSFFGVDITMDLAAVTKLETEQNGFVQMKDNAWNFTNGKQIHRYFFGEHGLNTVHYDWPLDVSLEEVVAEFGPYDRQYERAKNVYFWFGTMSGIKCTIRFDDYPYEELRRISLYVDEDQDGFSD